MAAVHHHPFHRDADGIDAWKDEWATGEDPYDPEYVAPRRRGRPFVPLCELAEGPGSHRHQSSAFSLRAGGLSESGGGPLSEPLEQPGSGHSSSPLPGVEEVKGRPGGHRDGR